ncbi:hypothetical protein FVD38_25620 [Massilia arenae]|uniref:Uncharacterized protein n=1 Tax=Massilia arenae TaxID=2603288 RepID=A0A5C7FLD6_9BURK|nr:hypothetical protein FVD38_25620 [Massilia arenae]
MLVLFDWRALLVVFVFLVSLAMSSVKTFAFLSGATPPASAYVVAVLFAVLLYFVFSLARMAIKAFLKR